METEQYKGHTIEIKHDPDPINPRENDNICIFHNAHKDYALGDVNYNTYESIKKAEEECIKNGDTVLPLYMYDHSGITISLSPFDCKWDSGQVGYVIIPTKDTPLSEDKILEIARAEVKELDTYLRGEIYGYIIDDGDDSCWGFYSEEEAQEEAKRVVDYIVKEAKKKHCEQVKTWIKNKVPLSVRTSMEQALEV